MDQDQARQNCRARSGSKLFDILMDILKDFFENVDFENKSADDKQENMQNYPEGKELKHVIPCLDRINTAQTGIR